MAPLYILAQDEALEFYPVLQMNIIFTKFSLIKEYSNTTKIAARQKTLFKGNVLEIF